MSRWKKFLKSLGPGFITGASDDDPSGIATYAQTGAQFGYSQLWMAVFSLPFMIAIQEMCGRIAIVTGKGLARLIKDHYSRWLLYGAIILLFLANIVNIGADLGAMASSAQLLLPLPLWLYLLFFTVGTLFLQIVIHYRSYARILKYFTLSLFSYVITAFFVSENWSAVLHATLFPHLSLDPAYILNIVAVLGTTISPYLFFWQADEEIEELHEHFTQRQMGHRHVNERDTRAVRLDTVIGMLFSNVITFFIILTAASTLSLHGIHTVDTATQAAEALRPFAGNFVFLVFALGIIGTGLLAVPVLSASASYALCEIRGAKASLDDRFDQARLFYWIIIIATVLGALLNFGPIPPFKMLYYAAVLNGLCAPPLMVFILLIGMNRRIMGDFTNSLMSSFFGIAITVIMALAGGFLVWSVV